MRSGRSLVVVVRGVSFASAGLTGRGEEAVLKRMRKSAASSESVEVVDLMAKRDLEAGEATRSWSSPRVTCRASRFGRWSCDVR
jgi:hypothetical protein